MYTYSKQNAQKCAEMTGILEDISSYYHVSIDKLKGKRRVREVIWPRQVAMYLLREETKTSLALIGNVLGGRDHTTVMHGLHRVQTQLQKYEHVRDEIADVRASFSKR